MKTIEPEYYNKFRCLGADCQDSCCTGWDVAIDKNTYKKYRYLPADPLKDMLMQSIKVDFASSCEHNYAAIDLDEDVCPFFNGLCQIQTVLGENYLSHTCASFPRVKNQVDDALERSLCLSCPEAARLALLSPEKMTFKLTDGKTVSSNVLSLLSTSVDTKPYCHFYLIRDFVIELLQNRDYPLWQRLIILGFITKKIDEQSTREYAEIPTLLERFRADIEEGAYTEILDNFAPDQELQLQVTAILLNHRMQDARCHEGFSAFCSQVLNGIGYDHAPLGIMVKQFNSMYDNYYLPFLVKHEYILENYLVNYVFRSLFPLGPTQNMYKAERSMYGEYILLVCHFALLKTLLIGMSGYYTKALQPDEAISIIQSYSKAVEHHLNYQNKLVQFIEVSNMDSNPALAMLIKN